MADIKNKVTETKEKAKGWTEKHPKLTKALKVFGLIAAGAGIVIVGDKAVGAITNKDSDDEDFDTIDALPDGGDDSE